MNNKINVNNCAWCGKEREEHEDGKFDDAGNWSCYKCFVEHNAR